MISRKTLTTVTSSEWIMDNETSILWLTVTTDKTGDQKFQIVGTRHYKGLSDYNQKWAVGTVMPVSELHSIPRVIREVWATIEPGVNIHIGIMNDGLANICGLLGFTRLVNYGSMTKPRVPEHLVELTELALADIYANKVAAAVKRLQDSGEFEKVHTNDFQIGISLDDECVHEMA